MQLNAVKIKEGLDSYHAPRSVEDIDLIAMVREILTRTVPLAQIESAYDRDLIIQDAVRRQPHVQRFLLNRYWFRQIVFVPVDSMEVRSSLIIDGTEEEWVRMFMVNVLPFIVAHGLPRMIQSSFSND